MRDRSTERADGSGAAAFLEATGDGFWECGRDALDGRLEPLCWTLLGGARADEETFDAWRRRFVDDAFAEALGELTLDAPALSRVVRARHRDGHLVPLQLRARIAGPVDHDGALSFHGTIRRPIEPRQRDLDLQTALDFRELVFEAQDDLMFVKDAEFRIVQANAAFLALYPPGVRDSVIGTTTFEAYDAEQMRSFVAEDQRALDDGHSEVEETIDMPDGRRRVLWTKKVRFTDAAGARFVLGVARDITEQKRVNLELRRANEELEEFTYRVSHDLRAPLISALRLVEHGHDALERQDTMLAARTLSTARDALRRLRALADDLLDLARLRFGDREPVELDVPALVDETWARLTADTAEPPVRLETDYRIDAAAISDASGFVLILDNLLSNALKYHDPAADDPWVRVAVSIDPRKLELEVSDNGLGVPEANRDRLFRMFERMHPRSAPGSGLGLYMVQTWAERLGGSAAAEHPGTGVRFRIELPHLRRRAPGDDAADRETAAP